MRALDGCESEEEQAQPHGQRHWDMSNGKQCGQREGCAGGGDVIVTLTHMQRESRERAGRDCGVPMCCLQFAQCNLINDNNNNNGRRRDTKYANRLYFVSCD